MSEAEQILDFYASRQGWNQQSQMDLALRYIENQGSNGAWRDFLQDCADVENDMDATHEEIVQDIAGQVEMREYALGRDGRGKYEDDPRECSTDTASVWVVHLNAQLCSTKAIEVVLDRVGMVGQNLRVTGEYAFDGDSWEEWGTPATDDYQHKHLAIYYHASPSEAFLIGERIAIFAFAYLQATMVNPRSLTPTDFAISTAGDYAEQVNG